MRISKSTGISILLTALTVASLAGSSLGTLAWYAYSTRAKIEMTGTAVQSTQQLQIGIYCRDWAHLGSDYTEKFNGSEETPNATYGTYMETIGEDHYIWMPAGQGFTENTINEYLTLNGCASDELTPTSTRPFGKDDPMHVFVDDKGNDDPADDERIPGGIDEGDIQLYDSLNAGDPINAQRAKTGSYIELPLAFRIIAYEGIVQSFAQGKPIWLTDVTSSALPVWNFETEKYETRQADKALRIHVYNKAEETSFAVNPAIPEDKDHHYTYDQQYTHVAGLLNLKKSGYYDTDISGREILYGDFDWTDPELKNDLVVKTFKEGPSVGEIDATALTLADAETNVNNVADVTPSSDTSTFLANHRNGTTGYTNFLKGGVGDDIRKKAYYYSVYDIAPTTSGAGDYSDGMPVGKTASDENKFKRIARTDLTIWLEGWDHSIIDNNIGTKFNLGLTFEINRV